MKKLLLISFLLISCSAFSQTLYTRPNPPQAVNDFGNFLEAPQRAALEQKIRAYNDSTSSAIVIITVPDLQGDDIADLSLKYLRGWGIGTKEKNNGILILVSKQDRKARIETGYGMEGPIPDITAKHIIDEQMIPNFKTNDYYEGFDKTIDAIIKAAAGEYQAAPVKSVSPLRFKPILILIIIIIFFIISSRGGSGGGSSIGRGGALPFILGSMLGSGFGGGGRGGDGGGFGGGGFGGFGGGGGGGGGASGGW